MKRMLNIEPAAGLMLLFLAFAGIMISCHKEEQLAPEEGAEVTAIHITDPASGELELEQGEQYMIRYEVEPEHLRRPKMNWSINDEKVAEVKNGKIDAMKPGNATVTVSSGKAYAEVALTVKPIHINDFTLPSSLEVIAGEEVEIPVTMDPSRANANCLQWESDHPEIADVKLQNGKAYLSGNKEGSCTITASAGQLKKTMKVDVYPERCLLAYEGPESPDHVSIKENDRVSFNVLPYVSGTEKRRLFFKVFPTEQLEISDFSVTVSEKTMYSVALQPNPADPGMLWIDITGLKITGESSVKFTWQDKKLDTVLEWNFVLYSEAVLNASDVIYDRTNDRKMKADHVIYGEKTVNRFLQIGTEGEIPVKWTVSNPEVIEIDNKINGEIAFRKSVVIRFGGTYGTTTLTAEDSAGNEISISITVKHALLPADHQAWLADLNKKCSPDNLTYIKAYRRSSHTLELRPGKTDAEIYVKEWRSSDPNLLNITNPSASQCTLTVYKKGACDIYYTDDSGKEYKLPFKVEDTIEGLKLGIELNDGWNVSDMPDGLVWLYCKSPAEVITKKITLLDGPPYRTVTCPIRYCNRPEIDKSTGQGTIDIRVSDASGNLNQYPYIEFKDYFGVSLKRTFRWGFHWDDGWKIYALRTEVGLPSILLSISNRTFRLEDGVRYSLVAVHNSVKGDELASGYSLECKKVEIVKSDGTTILVTNDGQIPSYARDGHKKVKCRLTDWMNKTKEVTLNFK